MSVTSMSLNRTSPRRTTSSGTSLTSIVTRVLSALRPAVVQAHCDTADGPAAQDARRALETGNVNHALKWIPADGEAELRDVFEKAMRVRAAGGEAAELADRLFVETMVRLHRMGEGVGFTGVQPSGAHVDPLVAAADAAIASGSDEELLPLVPEERRAELDDRFQSAVALQDFDVDDVAAGRRYLAAYVDFFKYAEGEDHHHGHPHGADPTHAAAHTHDPAHAHQH